MENSIRAMTESIVSIIKENKLSVYLYGSVVLDAKMAVRGFAFL